ncbi:MAG: glyoxalase/bleomycin resistance/extradiol dioxygenase family protein [Roseibium sp.]|uniref:VOC family protein n=1 Tax=Roseibium sp. TaxID=1936156 RepID=UPI00262B383B|nr:glyoxalase/bleomycin resistance/extradiol dioxygenase family protein [Roseibium sp.]MCV0426922.1 glyoxalase/bleomycin resistance/extradiol dioxygenase family protein [Roseibium sp.]
MQPIPYVFFNGNCAEAMARYAEIFGGEPELLPASQMPPEFPVSDDRKHWIMHGSLKIGDGLLMASDNLMGETGTMAGCAVTISMPDLNDARAAFEKLAKGGEITMPFAPTFWSAGFGTLTDRFGVHWMVGCDQPPS